jgi:hypothetical protein
LNSDLADYKVQKNQTTFVMKCAGKAFYTDFISQNSTNQRKLFQASKILFTQGSDLMFPEYGDPDVLANDIGEFFVQKIEHIHAEFYELYPKAQSAYRKYHSTATALLYVLIMIF